MNTISTGTHSLKHYTHIFPTSICIHSLTHSFMAPSTCIPMKSHSWVKVLHVRSCERQAVLGKAVEGAECCLLLALLFSKELEDR